MHVQQGKLDPHSATDEKAKELLGMRVLHQTKQQALGFSSFQNWKHILAFARLSDGIAGPLGKLQELYKTMVNLQGDAMVTAPNRLESCFVFHPPCIKLI